MTADQGDGAPQSIGANTGANEDAATTGLADARPVPAQRMPPPGAPNTDPRPSGRARKTASSGGGPSGGGRKTAPTPVRPSAGRAGNRRATGRRRALAAAVRLASWPGRVALSPRRPSRRALLVAGCVALPVLALAGWVG